jgi:hypothetical protein
VERLSVQCTHGSAGVEIRPAAADIEEFTRTATFQIMQSVRLDRGVTISSYVHPYPS